MSEYGILYPHFQTFAMTLFTRDVFSQATTEVPNVTETPVATSTHTVVTRTYPTAPSSPSNNVGGGNDGPSWGLIIPILMIGLFLACVAFCLYWHKWRDKRSQRDQTGTTPASSFHRSYRGSRSNRGVDTIRDSMRSTTPLRSSVNEKTKAKQNRFKVTNVNVIPIQRPATGKYSFYWDQNHWKVCPYPPNMTASRHSGSRPLSPITEVDSPNKLSELSKNYDVSAQPSDFSPYHLTWITPNPPPSYEQSESKLVQEQSRCPIQVIATTTQHDGDHLQGYAPCKNSPFFPNNNTPTTECDVDSVNEGSQIRFIDDITSSQYTSYPSSPTMSRSNPGYSASPDTDDRSTSVASSYPETSYQPSSRQSERQSGYHNSGMTSLSDPFGENMSLPSSISQFQQQATVIEDHNNNSIVVPNSYLSYPAAKGLNYTLASSLESSDSTHYSDNTSMLPNVGSSSNTTGVQSVHGLRSLPLNNEHSGNVSQEDLSKLVDEMSSIRPNSSAEPTARVISISGQSFTADFHRSCANIPEEGQNSAGSTTTNEISFVWDNYPLNETPIMVRSNPELPLHVKEDQLYRKQTLERSARMSFHAPVLSEKQYWV